MTKERALTRLTLTPATVMDREGWVEASWSRADGSTGRANAVFRRGKDQSWYLAFLLVAHPKAAELRDVPLTRIETAANADPAIREWMQRAITEDMFTRHVRRVLASKRPRLERPAARRPLPDQFFKEVAAAYRGAVADGLSPSKTLAEDANTPPGTVNRWIAEARRRGYLPKGEPGKVTV